MRNGLYRVHFQTPRGGGAGVVALQDGKISGGDSRIYYTGTYSESGVQFTAQVKTDAHTPTPGMVSVFGVDRVNITLKGTSTGDSAQLTGTAAEAPGSVFKRH